MRKPRIEIWSGDNGKRMIHEPGKNGYFSPENMNILYFSEKSKRFFTAVFLF